MRAPPHSNRVVAYTVTAVSHMVTEVSHAGDRTVKALRKFLKTHANVPFQLPSRKTRVSAEL